MLGDTPPRELRRDDRLKPSRRSRRLRGWLLAGAFLSFSSPAALAQAQNAPARAEISGALLDGFARLVFTLPEDTEADVRLAGAILIVSFKRPVSAALDHLPVAAAGYVAAVRRDPDGRAVRLALSRKVKVNTIAAGERLFVDLLPETWTGPPPGLPQEVVDELARRAREAEAKLRQAEEAARRRRTVDVRARVASLPTLTRYVFEIPEGLAVETERDEGHLSLVFAAPVNFDLADAKAALAPAIAGIEAETKDGATVLRFSLAEGADVRSFREDGAVMVDAATPKRPEPAAPSAAGGRAAPRGAAASPAAPPKVAAADAPPGAVAAPAPVPAEAVARPAVPIVAPKAAEASATRPKPDAPDGKVAPAAGDAPRPPAQTAAAAAAGASATLKRQGDKLQLVFPFAAPTPAAVFARGDTLWLVFDTTVPLDVARLRDDPGKTVRDASAKTVGSAQAVRLKLGRPAVAHAAVDGSNWVVTLGENSGERTVPFAIARTRTDARAVATVALPEAGKLHRLPDGDHGDTLLVVTAPAPARGLPRTQDFVDFRALASAHGLGIVPYADDLAVTVDAGKVTLDRPDGLTFTAVASPAPSSGLFGFQPTAFDPQTWGYDRQAEPRPRETALMAKAAEAADNRRTPARLDLARFYMAQDKLVEAKGVLDTVLLAETDHDLVAATTVLRGVTHLLLGREELALKDFASPALGNQHDAGMWRALALARMGRYGEAAEGLKQVEAAAATLPVELQRVAVLESARTSFETGNFADAARRLRDLDSIGLSPESAPAAALLSGRIAEGLGRPNDALAAYQSASETRDQTAAAQARLREIVLRYEGKQASRDETVKALEALSAAWRGDETELETLQRLARFYTEEGRFREAFGLMRVALSAHPRSERTRRIQDEAGATFESVFLGDRGNALTPVEALGLFYDFRSLTPPGRRGDEMIRRLAERLVSMDLLGQAGELLQHQVDRRLGGVARAQVATRLATVYLMDRKPARALKTLHDTRVAEMPKDLRKQRLLLEARALSDTGRPALALEIIEGMTGREVDRLRADVLWSAARWQEAAEQMERLYGERWRDFTPLDADERADVLRAAVAYALAGDAIGSDRFRQRYAAKMADGPERRMFDVVTAPLSGRSDEFRAIAKAASTVDTLTAFLRDLNGRFPPGNAATSSAPPPARRQGS